MGMKVEPTTFGHAEILGFAAVLTIAAIIGKRVCSLATLGRHINRLSVGLDMVPRAEVGLIFTGIGLY